MEQNSMGRWVLLAHCLAKESEGEWDGKNFYCARCSAKLAVQGHKEDYHEDMGNRCPKPYKVLVAFGNDIPHMWFCLHLCFPVLSLIWVHLHLLVVILHISVEDLVMDMVPMCYANVKRKPLTRLIFQRLKIKKTSIGFQSRCRALGRHLQRETGLGRL